MNKQDQWDSIIIEDWVGNILFKGHFEDPKVDQVLDANRCDWCKDAKDHEGEAIEGCSSCDDTGYEGDFEVRWADLKRAEIDNVYEFINY